MKTPFTQQKPRKHVLLVDTKHGAAGMKLLKAVLLLLFIGVTNTNAQAPVISYSSPQVYQVGSAISPLSPSNTGGTVPNGTPVAIAGTYTDPRAIAIDASGNVYIADVANNAVKELVSGASSAITIGSGFSSPTGVAVDASGNAFVADNSNGAIKKIPAGNGAVVTLVTGLNGPYGIALDGSGYMYVTEQGNNDVKKIPVAGGTAQIIGTGFHTPTGITVDASGNVYVTDRANNAIKKILASDGSTVTLSSGAGNPNGVAVDQAGNIYFADANLSTITKIPLAGGSNVALGSGFSNPNSVSIDAKGNIFIGDSGNHKVKELPVGGYVVSPSLPAGLSINKNTGLISGTPTATSAAANFTVTASNASGSGTAIINITINLPPKPIISYSTPQVYTVAQAITPLSPGSTGGPIPSTGAFSVSPALPGGLSLNINTGVISGTPSSASAATGYTVTATNAGGSGTAVINITINLPAKPVISYTTPQVYTATVAISPLSPTNTGGAVPANGFSISPALPSGLSFNLSTGTLSGTPSAQSPATDYTVTATNAGGSGTATINIKVNPYPLPTISYSSPQTYPVNSAITPLSPSVTSPGTAGSIKTTVLGSGFINFRGVAVDAAGNVYIAEDGNNAIREIPAGGGATLTLGSGFSSPTGVAVDASGNVFVADNGNGDIKKIPAGNGAVVTLVTGLNGPYDIALDGSGYMYVTEGSGNDVKKIPVGGGTAQIMGTGLNTPTGIAVDASGNVYVTDRGNNAIKKILANNTSTISLGTAFGNPNGVAVDQAGDVYFADTNNASILEIPAQGGSYVKIGTSFSQPIAVAADLSDSNIIYVETAGNEQVQKITPTGSYFISPALPAGLTMSSTTGTISGTPTMVTAAIDYTVKTYNVSGSASAVINLAVYSANAGLSNLTLSSGSLSPAFATSVNSYSTAEANSVSSITVTPTASAGSYTITVNGTAVASGAASQPISLNVGANTISVIVKSSGGQIVGSYTVTANRSQSSNNNLAALAINLGTLTPSFSPATTDYSAQVTGNAGAIEITPTVADPTATVKVNNTTVASGTSAGVALSYGANAILVKVTAQDGTQKTYTLTVTRTASSNANLASMGPSIAPLSPTFSSGTTSYTLSVSNAAASMTVKPGTSDANATVTVNGAAIASGTVSQPIALAEGTQTLITVVVTAQDKTTTKTYTITVTRAPSAVATLSNIALSAGTLSPVFASGTVNYTAAVPNANASITLTPTTTDAHATVTVNGSAVASGAASGPIALAVGANSITTVITSQNGAVTKTYEVTVTRSAPVNTNLSSIGASASPLTPAFNPATTSYTLSVSNATASMTVKPVTGDASATLAVNGAALASGTVSSPIALAEGTQTLISIVVTGRDGITTKTYTITVTRAASTVATLSNISLSSGTYSPLFSSGTVNYTAGVPNTTSSIMLTPTTTNAHATITVNSSAVSSGSASAPIALAVGANNITTIVTAQDGTTTKTYTLTVTRAPSTNANLASMNPSVGPLNPTFVPGTTSYTLGVSNATSSMTVRPVTSESNATMTVNGTALASGTTSAPIALAVGSNTITIVVTAQSGTTTKTYTIAVTRASGGADSFGPGISVTKPSETPALAEDGILVHQGISPNGDGLNDFLQIDNISHYPDNKLTIMNRNGQLVYEAKGYDNSSKTFDGHSNKNGQMQLPGTYFYQLDYTVSGITKHKTGFIVLKY